MARLKKETLIEERQVVGETMEDKLVRLIYYVVGVVNVILLLRLILRAFGANRISPFVQLIYNLSDIFLAPFRNVFDVAAAGEMVIEPAILVAMVVYTLMARGVVELIYILNDRSV